MANKPILSGSLNIRTPLQSASNIAPKRNASPGMFMNVPVSDIDFFDKNPRKIRDPESYEQIKASIRASGVQQPVHITQRPNSEHYVLAQGGNTRLSIVKELFEETQDNRFASIPCIFVEYTDETSIQIAHLIENEQRQEMCFWDKAQAYSEIRDIFHGAAGKGLTLRECETVFATHGLSIGITALSLFFFANDKLKPLENLAADLSRSKTSEISKCYNECKKQFKNTEQNEQEFEDWFTLAIMQYAETHAIDQELDTEILVRDLENSFTQTFDIHEQDLFKDFSSTLNVEDDNLNDTDIANSNTQYRNDDENIITTDGGIEVSISRVDTPSKTTSNTRKLGSLGGDSTRTPKIPKSYDISTTFEEEDITETVVDDNQDAPVKISQLDELINQTIDESSFDLNDLHQAICELLNYVGLTDCFQKSDQFSLHFYVEYPDFDAIEQQFKEQSGFYASLIDKVHLDAGDILSLLMKISGQEQLFLRAEDENNPILSLPESSRFRKSFIDSDYTDQINYVYVGDRVFLANKLIDWLLNTNSEIGRLVERIFVILRKIR